MVFTFILETDVADEVIGVICDLVIDVNVETVVEKGVIDVV